MTLIAVAAGLVEGERPRASLMAASPVRWAWRWRGRQPRPYDAGWPGSLNGQEARGASCAGRAEPHSRCLASFSPLWWDRSSWVALSASLTQPSARESLSRLRSTTAGFDEEGHR